MTTRRILMLSQTPPPVHGQAVMAAHLASVPWTWCRIEHVRLGYSDAIEQVGRFSLTKVLRLALVVARVWRARLHGPADLLYYLPAGPHRLPVYRDIVTLLLVRWTARRVVFHFHAGGFDNLLPLLTPPERALARMAYGNPDLAIVPLPSLAGEVAWISPRRTAVVPNGLPDEGAGSPGGRGERPLRILFVGTLSEEKGVLDLVEAFRILVAGGMKLELHLAGGFRPPAFASRLHARIHAAGLENITRPCGILNGAAKAEEYVAADIFCFPTRDSEAMPLVLLEAMRAGLPIVTTRWRAIPDLVGEAAVLVPPADPERLASGLAGLLRSIDRRRAMGAKARMLFISQYTLERHLESMEHVLRKAMDEREEP